jgi:hypothetical protein
MIRTGDNRLRLSGFVILLLPVSLSLFVCSRVFGSDGRIKGSVQRVGWVKLLHQADSVTLKVWEVTSIGASLGGQRFQLVSQIKSEVI